MVTKQDGYIQPTPLGARAVMRGSSWSATLVGELRAKRAVLAVNAVSRKPGSFAV
jgi:hypothetical protein